jgi:hypothetical protein
VNKSISGDLRNHVSQEETTAVAVETTEPKEIVLPLVTADDLARALRELRDCCETHQVYSFQPSGPVIPIGPETLRIKGASALVPTRAMDAFNNASHLLKRYEKEQAVANANRG